MEAEVEVNIQDEINRLVSTKYLEAMEELVAPANIIDESEVKAFDCYTERSNHLLEKSGIPDYSRCWQPLP